MSDLIFFILFLLFSSIIAFSSNLSIGSTTDFSSEDTLYFYVSPTGNDQWTGRMPTSKGQDGPFSTPYRAVEAVKDQRDLLGKTQVPIVVVFDGGNYFLDRTLVIDSTLNGNQIAPTIFRAGAYDSAYFIGGIEINNKDLIQLSADYYPYFPSEVRDSIFEYDISRAGANLGKMNARGFARPESTAPAELFLNRKPLQLSRWPNHGWAKISDVSKGRYSGQFLFLNKRINDWKYDQEVWLQGFWANDYAESYVQVSKVDTVNYTIFTRKGHNKYGFVKGKRFCAINVLEELDEPGEYYVDFNTKKILLWPPVKSEENELILSMLEEPLLSVRNAQHISIQGITFEITRGKAIVMEGGEDNTIYDCIIRNTGGRAIEVLEGRSNKILKCEIYNTGEGSILLTGGDRKTLVSSEHMIVNNHIYNTNRLVKTSDPCVRIEGVGNTIRNNYIHDLPYMAIRIYGNENIIEYNEIAHIGKESGDVGAIYIGRDWSMQGNIIRYNFFHDMNSPYYRGIIGIYLDDLASGTNIHNNIFNNVQTAVVIGGGRNNRVEGNVFENSSVAAVKIEYRQRSAKNSEKALRSKLADVPYQNSLWREKYPHLINILEDEPLAPKYNIIQKNVATNGKWLVMDKNVEETQKIKKNKLLQDVMIFQDNQSEPLKMQGLRKIFSDIPVEKMGLQK